ncbi:DegT/DnrJ/EryC1/StrS family aminotransferase [Marimonas lutisalis]|uniref:DegT/DnrJ/EryC1/StrS family aminotransferase n=1 Tax=Marimonas lutisalis TaxID=2545756 RepID=UPI00196114B3|nr:DegT/DnrJ/EryC1/StrS family aminotransferase [Marimonas lutisalis]
MKEILAVNRVLASGRLLRYARGERSYTARFETAMARKFGVDHVLTVNSGTNALITALAAAGIGPGDEVLVPAYTWVATALAPLAVGAVPVLVDIDESLTIDPADIERRITPHTKAIIPVHMLNLVADMDAILDIAQRHGLKVIEDACQCVGGIYKGRRVGAIGDLGALSFNHYKNMTSGEGGAVLCNDERLFVRARMYHDPGSFIRDHARFNEPLFAAMNFRVSEITGTLLHSQLSRLDSLMARLKARRTLLAKAFSNLPDCHISPHNDPENALGLTVVFNDERAAELLGQTRGVQRLIETNRHVFTNWEAVLCKRSFDERMNPHRWAHRDISYDPADYQTTLDVLSRTCVISLRPDLPLFVLRRWAKSLRRKATRTLAYLSPQAAE